MFFVDVAAHLDVRPRSVLELEDDLIRAAKVDSGPFHLHFDDAVAAADVDGEVAKHSVELNEGETRDRVEAKLAFALALKEALDEMGQRAVHQVSARCRVQDELQGARAGSHSAVARKEERQSRQQGRRARARELTQRSHLQMPKRLVDAGKGKEGHSNARMRMRYFS